LTEIAASATQGLLPWPWVPGLQALAAMFDAEALCGPPGRHTPERAGYRHGEEHGSVTPGGRRVALTRPRAADGSGALHLPPYTAFSGTELLGAMAMEKMLAGLSTRRYPVGLEPVGQQVSAEASTTSKSAVSRKCVAAPETALAKLLAADLTELDLVAWWRGGTSASTPASSLWGSTAPSTRWPWPKARPRTPHWSATFWWDCASAA
jgi:hypothetical protein